MVRRAKCSRCGNLLVTLAGAAALLLAGCAGAPPPPAAPQPAPDAPPAPVAVPMDAELAARDGDYARAIEILTQILAVNPHDIEALRLLARVHAAAGDCAASSAAWERVALLDPHDPDAAYEIGSSLAADGAWEQVRARMLQVEAGGTADDRHYLLAGRAALQLGLRAEAETMLRKAVDIELARSLLGTLYYERGELGAAEEAFRRALALNARNFTANLHLGYLSYRRGDLREAIEYYRAAHAIDGTNPLACLSLAAALEKSGDRSSAVEYYTAGLRLPGTPAAERRKVHLTIVRLLYELGRDEQVARAAERGLTEFPGHGGLYFYWGEALLRGNDPAGAREKYKQAAEDSSWRKAALARFHSIR